MPGIALSVEPGHSLPVAGSQEWLWLSLGAETGFLRESGKLSKCIVGVRGQAGPSWQATPWQSEPSREENVHGWASSTVIKNGKQR